MEVIRTVEGLRKQTKEWKKDNVSIGFVPTMGYLHEGHESLISESLKKCDKTVVSIFVNPMQFGEGEDLAAYPRDFEKDERLLKKLGVDILFYPDKEEMYPNGFVSYIDMDSPMPAVLCGKTRPIHFKGVCTVVCKLLNMVMPDKAFFGEKDAQQLAIIRRMVKDFNMDVEIVGCPIIREVDGLAKSSRNSYLSAQERKAALIISKAMRLGQCLASDGEKNATIIVAKMKELIQTEPLAKVDYVEAVDKHTLEQVDKCGEETLFAAAAYIGKTRLLDNFSGIHKRTI